MQLACTSVWHPCMTQAAAPLPSPAEAGRVYGGLGLLGSGGCCNARVRLPHAFPAVGPARVVGQVVQAAARQLLNLLQCTQHAARVCVAAWLGSRAGAAPAPLHYPPRLGCPASGQPGHALPPRPPTPAARDLPAAGWATGGRPQTRLSGKWRRHAHSRPPVELADVGRPPGLRPTAAPACGWAALLMSLCRWWARPHTCSKGRPLKRVTTCKLADHARGTLLLKPAGCEGRAAHRSTTATSRCPAASAASLTAGSSR